MVGVVRILGFAGSLRRGSFNRALLRAAVGLVPEGVTLEVFELDGIPPFSQDLEADPPGRVVELKARVRAADAVLIVTPEHSYSVPGVLKNALDWAIRAPDGDNPFEGKPVAIMSASTGMFGGVRAQHHLRQVLVALDTHALSDPEVMVANAAGKFDEGGALTDERTRERIRRLLEALVEFTRKMKG